MTTAIISGVLIVLGAILITFGILLFLQGPI